MLLAIAERLTSERLDVGVAVLRGRPTPAAALSTLAAEVVHVVPVFMADGQMASAVRSRLPAHGSGRLVHHPTVGSHPDMAAVVDGLIRRALAENALRGDETAVVLAGHGNARHPAAGGAIHDLADRLRTRAAAAEIHGVFLEQAPMVEAWPTLTRLPSVLVVPCFLSAGAHAREDLPRRLRTVAPGDGTTGADARLHLAPPLAMATGGLAAIVRDLFAAAAHRASGSESSPTIARCDRQPTFTETRQAS